jgi:hypothetical protein
MSTLTMRIDSQTHAFLKDISHQLGEPMQAVLHEAIELYRRECFLKSCNEAYAALKKNPKAWKQELEERKSWESTLND